MTNDIVTRLRESNGMTTSRSSDGFLSIHPHTDLMREAADEIERWQGIARRLYLFIQDPCTHDHWCDICSSIDAYEKAVEGE